jgi:hypothetical protein
MSDLFREVDEEVRRERYLKLWRAYGKYAIAALLAFLIGAGAALAWRDYRLRSAQEESSRYAAALAQARAGKTAVAAEAFLALAEDSRTAYRALAALQAAAQRLAADDRPGAVAIYDKLAKDTSAERIWRDLAQLLAALALADTGPPAELEQRLAPLMAEDNIWRHTALELSAVAKLRAGDVVGAKAALQALKEDQTAPPGLRTRADEMLAALGQS